jgi:hypothetical protein
LRKEGSFQERVIAGSLPPWVAPANRYYSHVILRSRDLALISCMINLSFIYVWIFRPSSRQIADTALNLILANCVSESTIFNCESWQTSCWPDRLDHKAVPSTRKIPASYYILHSLNPCMDPRQKPMHVCSWLQESEWEGKSCHLCLPPL